MYTQLIKRSLLLSAALATAGLSVGCGEGTDDPTVTAAASGIDVVDHEVETHGVRLALGSPITAAALDGVTPKIAVSGPDPVTDVLGRRELPARATIEDDGYSLVLTIGELISAESAYAAVLAPADPAAEPVELARFDAPTRSVATRAATFEVKSTTPADGQGLFSTDDDLWRLVDRDEKYIRITFTPGHVVNCADLRARGADGIRVYAVHHPGWDQDMYYDGVSPDAQNPGEYLYRGHIESCQGNKVDFRIPGRLHGGSEYRIRVRAKNILGAQSPTFVGKFKTENPGLEVTLTRFDNHMSYDCDSKIGTKNDRCDTYVVMNAAWLEPKGRDGGITHVVPTITPPSGNWSNWLRSEHILLDHTMMVTTQPVIDEVLLTFAAFDHDNGDRAKNAVKITGAVHTAVGSIVSIFTPYGAIPAAVGTVLTAIGEAMKNNDDDNLGRKALLLERGKGWWGTTKYVNAEDEDAQYGRKLVIDNKLGSIWVRYKVEQYPAAWRANTPLL